VADGKPSFIFGLCTIGIAKQRGTKQEKEACYEARSILIMKKAEERNGFAKPIPMN
jgi:hypothetical protein